MNALPKVIVGIFTDLDFQVHGMGEASGEAAFRIDSYEGVNFYLGRKKDDVKFLELLSQLVECIWAGKTVRFEQEIIGEDEHPTFWTFEIID